MCGSPRLLSLGVEKLPHRPDGPIPHQEELKMLHGAGRGVVRSIFVHLALVCGDGRYEQWSQCPECIAAHSRHIEKQLQLRIANSVCNRRRSQPPACTQVPIGWRHITAMGAICCADCQPDCLTIGAKESSRGYSQGCRARFWSADRPF